ncbi:hypothetical protein BS47DRAFT_1351225 [Hydnum rufescens UP504]|uniref:Uncharacterized protein n=1 Tax=Hydnum rufescens UP504 TaxID=1448309 RepID=A0A9P6ALG6_9AGAM|nr:hypothetical protein BS47DRAFT_1351225 [Hydnum rufescens UP504]
MPSKSGEYTEEDIQKALAELTEGVHYSVAAAAKEYCIPPGPFSGVSSMGQMQ